MLLEYLSPTEIKHFKLRIIRSIVLEGERASTNSSSNCKSSNNVFIYIYIFRCEAAILKAYSRRISLDFNAYNTIKTCSINIVIKVHL